MIKEAAGYAKRKKGKNLFFSKQHYVAGFEPLLYFTFWIIP